jgi:hypothetical protein
MVTGGLRPCEYWQRDAAGILAVMSARASARWRAG